MLSSICQAVCILFVVALCVQDVFPQRRQGTKEPPRSAVTLCALASLRETVRAKLVQAQTTSPKLATASISGKVTIKGKPAVGVPVVAGEPEDQRTSKSKLYRARTDEAGSYRIRNLPAGTYEISSFTPALVSVNDGRSLVVSEGEQIEDVNLALVPGGVITGKITDSEGKPVIAQYVKIMPVIESLPSFRPSLIPRLFLENTTDDRGVYRAFGLPPGKYRVSVGESDGGRKGSQPYFTETFYPSVTDAAKAEIIEVKEGSETKGVDIAMSRLGETFLVTGRVVDGESGRPAPNLTYGVEHRLVEDGSSSGFSFSTAGDVTNAKGEFRIENVAPGAYTVFTLALEGSNVPTGSVSFEVIDRDVTDLLIKTTKGSSLSGVVVIDGDKKATAMLSALRINAVVEGRKTHFVPSSSSAINQDGTFQINGLPGGRVRLSLDFDSTDNREFYIARVERNGIPASETINVKARERVAGIRVLVRALKVTGTIRGQVKVEDGELPSISQLGLLLWPLDENLQPKPSHSLASPQLDARGRFVTRGLAAGTYRVSIYPTRATNPAELATQDVVVTDDNETEVTLVLKRRP